MQHIYIDITEFMRAESITGIQRVVCEVSLYFIESGRADITLVSYSDAEECFEICQNDAFVRHFRDHEGYRDEVFSDHTMNVGDFEKDSIFFDMDSSWSVTLRRSFLLPSLKKQGVFCVSLSHDIMPVTDPQYFENMLIFEFLEFIGAHLLYDDMIIATTNASLEILKNFAKKVGVAVPHWTVSHLGADFGACKKQDCGDDAVESLPSPKVLEVAGAGRYILMVGSIEPRKNHRLVFEAFKRGLAGMGINVIFAGRINPREQDLLDEIYAHGLFRKQIFHIGNASNADIAYLYKNAFATAFPTHNEGYGLPLVEALGLGSPVIATDIPVLREIGEDYCLYFPHDDIEGFLNCVLSLAKDDAAYSNLKEHIKSYRPETWNDCSKRILDAMLELAASSQPRRESNAIMAHPAAAR